MAGQDRSGGVLTRMDLHTVRALHSPRDRAELEPRPGPGAAPLGGGTWLFSEPQPHLDALVDLTAMAWPALTSAPDGALSVAATCTLAELAAAGPALFRACCRCLAGSFKIWHTATVGGNICLALPAGPMTSLCAGLDGRALLWGPDGDRRLPASTLRARTLLRRIALTAEGRSGAVVVGRRDEDGFVLTVTAATERPCRLVVPSRAALDTALATVDCWYTDPHGTADWRAHVTGRLAAEIVDELT